MCVAFVSFSGLGRQWGLWARHLEGVQAGPPSGRLQGAQDRLPGRRGDPLHRHPGRREDPDDHRHDLRREAHHCLQASRLHQVPDHHLPGVPGGAHWAVLSGEKYRQKSLFYLLLLFNHWHLSSLGRHASPQAREGAQEEVSPPRRRQLRQR